MKEKETNQIQNEGKEERESKQENRRRSKKKWQKKEYMRKRKSKPLAIATQNKKRERIE